MTGLFTTSLPSFGRVLLIESGARSLTDSVLPTIYADQTCKSVDVLTCYPDPPEHFVASRGRVVYVNVPPITANRSRFVYSLGKARYDVVTILATGTGTLKKWKYLIAVLTPAKVAVVGRDATLTFVNYQTLAKLPRLKRRHLGAARVAGELLLFPFTIAFLSLYASTMHARRLIRQFAGRT